MNYSCPLYEYRHRNRHGWYCGLDGQPTPCEGDINQCRFGLGTRETETYTLLTVDGTVPNTLVESGLEQQLIPA